MLLYTRCLRFSSRGIYSVPHPTARQTMHTRNTQNVSQKTIILQPQQATQGTGPFNSSSPVADLLQTVVALPHCFVNCHAALMPNCYCLPPDLSHHQRICRLRKLPVPKRPQGDKLRTTAPRSRSRGWQHMMILGK